MGFHHSTVTVVVGVASKVGNRISDRGMGAGFQEEVHLRWVFLVQFLQCSLLLLPSYTSSFNDNLSDSLRWQRVRSVDSKMDGGKELSQDGEFQLGVVPETLTKSESVSKSACLKG